MAGLQPRRNGITLTETLIASLLLAIALVPALKAFTQVQAMSTIVEKKTTSVHEARQKIENIRARAIYSYTTSFASASTQLDGSYYATITDSTISSTLREIRVSVGYDENANHVLESSEILVTLDTLIAKRW